MGLLIAFMRIMLLCVLGGTIIIGIASNIGLVLIKQKLNITDMNPDGGNAWAYYNFSKRHDLSGVGAHQDSWTRSGFFYSEGDDSAGDRHGSLRAALILTENGQPLGPAHADRNSIHVIGGGRFSFQTIGLDRALIFSTSDNSDPRSNHRHYQISYPIKMNKIVFSSALFLFGFFILIEWLMSRKQPIKSLFLITRFFILGSLSCLVISGAASYIGYVTLIQDLDQSDIGQNGENAFIDYNIETILTKSGLFYSEGDDNAGSQRGPLRSNLILLENGKPLGPSHAFDDVIQGIGQGAYSYRIFGSDRFLVFSTSDNSDPRRNGRHYQISNPIIMETTNFIIALILWTLLIMIEIEMLFRGVNKNILMIMRWQIPVLYSIIIIAVWFSVGFLLGRLTYPDEEFIPAQGGQHALMRKVKYYQEHANNYNLLFIGDSRTYCGIHPDLLDPITGFHSINLSNFANWFPTQYSLVEDIIPFIPKGTTVVWTIGYQNFEHMNAVHRIYPIKFSNALWYIWWGVREKQLFDNVFFYNRAFHFLAEHGETRKKFLSYLSKPIPQPSIALIGSAFGAPLTPQQAGLIQDPNMISAADEKAILSYYQQQPSVSSVSLTRDNGKVNSVVLDMIGGSYYRIEMTPAFFRMKQYGAGDPQTITDDEARSQPINPPDAGLLTLFEKILIMFKKNNINLIINEIDEAPYTYRNPIYRSRVRQMTRDIARPLAERYGFHYITTDLDQLNNSDYFDYNHLNSNGIEKYTKMLGAALINQITSEK